MKIPVIIDTDPGMDDAIAIFLAFSSDKLDIKALTTVAGNIPLERTTRNALDLVRYIEAETKVAQGAHRPLIKTLETAEWVHGNTGLGTLILPESPNDVYYKKAWNTIYEEAQACDGKLQLICLGPLTNIAITLMVHPDIKDKIEKITLMGGSSYLGNTTPSAEFNIYVDAEAADIVFKSGIPITMVTLDATNKSIVKENEIREICSIESRVSSAVKELLYFNADFRKRSSGLDGAIIHDALAVATVIEPDIIEKGNYHVGIETEGKLTYGRTVIDMERVTKNNPNAEVSLGLDREKFVEMFKDMMKAYI
ncbi:pyrimidine-specific ribonucleoside hydrolase [Proteiniborus ethanoligenes]|uniref:Pyrimidine-specific ribonucleoside hydrolase n=1 Tax=Proteiniborus ethanoligenes TaxID=415015 RepID=A0A1H3R679_9FIRM|nr:nucleoside hydrolase [Proteiniborus ethanoligenes]SDZ21274.1 pyrimidine-specific ribonucleoside hydrolase [Proteiniborus ethanoligenes]